MAEWFRVKAESHCSDNENDNDHDAEYAFYWLNCSTQNMHTLIQPMECVFFALLSLSFSLSLQWDRALSQGD